MYKPRDVINELARLIVESTYDTCNSAILMAEQERIAKLIEVNRHGVYEQVQYEYDCQDVRSTLVERGFFFVKEEYVDAIVHELQSEYDSEVGLWDNINNAINRVEYFWNIGLLIDIANFDESAAVRAIADYLIRVHADECTYDMDEKMLEALKVISCDPDCPKELAELTHKHDSSDDPLGGDYFMDALYNYLKEDK